ncbi:MAG: ankyrin repeat domain-containing protein [Coxiellaceae bacterium]|nr:MAG: ankyrin repeat domain-containing protein [Coxiellaceae bacterium]
MIVHAAATNAAILQILAEYKFDLNARCNGFISTGEGAWLAEDCGLSVFDIAAMDGACESMKVLIANQVSINSTNCYGETPLHYVASQGHFDGVQLLVGAGARLDIKNRDEEIPYELAVKHREIQLYLAEK